MSKTTIFRIDHTGAVDQAAIFGNSHRYAMMIWTTLADRYTPGRSLFEECWWGLVDAAMTAASAPLCDRLTYEVTFDKWATRGVDRLRSVAVAFREFDARHWPVGTDRHGVSHLPAMADELDNLADAGAYGACIWTTSTTSDPWSGYNFFTDGDHKWVGEDEASFT